jgi:hypothetical protein
MKTVSIVLATLIGLWLIRRLMVALANVLKRRIQSDTRNCGFCYTVGAASFVYRGKKGSDPFGICFACLPVALGPVPLDWALAKGYLTPLPAKEVVT